MEMNMAQRDVIVFGATSFVGQIVCRYLVDQFGVGETLTWAAAGRSAAKLEALRASLGEAAAGLPLLIADAADEAALRAMCAQARVVVSTVGPYALHGEPLVKVCAETGVDYCDLTGEVHWMRRMLDQYEAKAQASGARIVHCCGFDSIPSDLGVCFLQRQALEQFGQPCSRVTMRVRAMRGGVSGGTVASMMNVARDVAANPALRKALADPYLLCPRHDRPTTRQPNVFAPAFDADYGVWLAPFVMAGVNTRVVHRSNAVSDYLWGRDFRYDEAVLAGGGVKGRAKAFLMASALGGFLVASALPPSRWLLQRFFLPKPGEGPSPGSQEKGFFDFRFIGVTADGRRLRAKVTGDRDPGYGSTAKMLGQAAACLALDIGKSEKPGGFWTPSTIFGDRLIERLRSGAGLTFEVQR
jgi:short subunit dehydrogenase-like uncharacterized protein